MSATPATAAEVLADANRINTLEEAALRKILPNLYASNTSLTDPAFQAYMGRRPVVRLQIPTTSYSQISFTTTEKVIFNWTVTPKQNASGNQYYSYIIKGRIRVLTDGTNTFKFRFTGFSDQYIHYRALNSDNTVQEAGLSSIGSDDPWSGAIGGAGISESVILIEGLLESHTGTSDVTAGFSVKADGGSMTVNNAGFLEISIA